MTLVYTVGAFSNGAVAGSQPWRRRLLGRLCHPPCRRHVGFVAAWLSVRAAGDPTISRQQPVYDAGRRRILWLGWNGFNGGDPYFANANAGAAVLNTNT